MANETKFEIKGNFIVATDNTLHIEYFRELACDIKYTRDKNDNFTFFSNTALPNSGETKALYVLGRVYAEGEFVDADSRTQFVWTDSLDGTGTPFVSADEMDTYLSTRIGNSCGGGGGNDKGIETFILSPEGAIGTGVIWADSGFIGDLAVLLYADNLNEKASYEFYVLERIVLTDIAPEISFSIYSTNIPIVTTGDAIRWQLEARYIANNEKPTKVADETFLFTQILTNLATNTRQDELTFLLDRTKMADQDAILFSLTRISSDGADNYNGDIAVGQSRFIVETFNHNP